MSTIRFFPADLALCDPMMNYIEDNLPQKTESKVWQVTKDLALRVAYVAVQILIFTTIAYHLIGAALKLPLCVITVPMQLFGAEVSESLKGEQVIKHLATIYSIVLLTLASPFAILRSSRTCVETYKAFLDESETPSSLTILMDPSETRPSLTILIESEGEASQSAQLSALKKTILKAVTPRNEIPKNDSNAAEKSSKPPVKANLDSEVITAENSPVPPPLPPEPPKINKAPNRISVPGKNLSDQLSSPDLRKNLRKSSTGTDGNPPSPPRSLTPPKEGLDAMTQAIKVDLEKRGIRTQVEPSVTRIGDSAYDNEWNT